MGKSRLPIRIAYQPQTASTKHNNPPFNLKTTLTTKINDSETITNSTQPT